MLEELRKQTAQAIVNIFETGRVLGDYASVVNAAGDLGGLTYGKAQTTINSGNLYLLVKAYTEAVGAMFANELSPFLERLRARDTRLNNNTVLHNFLRRAGQEDDVMIEVQDAFFDRVYWVPAVTSAERAGITTALGTAVVYDGVVHGSWSLMRDRTNNRHGSVSEIGEKRWIPRYLDVRREWLANHTNHLLRRTVYRMDALKIITTRGNFDLDLPITVRGLVISEETLTPIVRARPAARLRLLMLENPFMVGEDIRQLQVKLIEQEFDVGEDGADGVFGHSTDAAVKAFQERNGLVMDGIVGRATRAALGMDID
jgi:chitosanase